MIIPPENIEMVCCVAEKVVFSISLTHRVANQTKFGQLEEGRHSPNVDNGICHVILHSRGIVRAVTMTG